ncbi:hypothetical protein Tco_0323599 [Tanacetum coccineum]
MVTHAFNIKNNMSMLVQKSQDHKKAKDHKMMIKDYAWLMISKKLKIHIQVKPIRTSSSLKSMITTTYHKLKIEVKDCVTVWLWAACDIWDICGVWAAAEVWAMCGVWAAKGDWFLGGVSFGKGVVDSCCGIVGWVMGAV